MSYFQQIANAGLQFQKSVKPGSIGTTILSRIFGRPLVPIQPVFPKLSTGTKILGTTAGAGLIAVSLPLGQGGETGLETIKTTTQEITDFFQKNPLILLTIVGLGIVLVIKK